MSRRLQVTCWTLIVVFQLVSYGSAYFNYIEDGKVTAEEMEAELPEIPETPEIIPIPGEPGPPQPQVPQPENEDLDVTYFPSPDDDGSYIRVVMSEEQAMTFHYMDADRPVTVLVSLPGFQFGPHRVQSDDVKFFLFTKKTGANGIQLYNDKANGPSVQDSWIKGGGVKILCHGYMSSSRKPFPQHMKDSYLKLNEDLNVILVDWSKLAHSIFYFTVAKETSGVGEQVALLVQRLIQEGLVTLDHVHFIGHSLGAHVGGSTGYNLERTRVGIVGRITGLDPAGPGFCNGDIGQLQTSDAHFVDVIHTDDSAYCDGPIAWIWNRNKGKWGSDATSGHSNFFPNGGHMQPGCGKGATDSCSHSRAYYYMEESFNDTSGATVFKGCECDTYARYLSGDCSCPSDENVVVMGEYTPVNKTGGKYFLRTGAKYPYSHVV